MNKIDRYENAKLFAIRMHGIQEYDGFPYHKHLKDVENVLIDFDHSQYGPLVVCAWLHDILEDCPVSYNDIKVEFGEEIAEIVFCVTDELGRNRKERKEKTYPKIKGNENALIIKLADRIANVESGTKRENNISKMYLKEHKEFKRALFSDDCSPVLSAMWKRLNNTIKKI